MSSVGLLSSNARPCISNGRNHLLAGVVEEAGGFGLLVMALEWFWVFWFVCEQSELRRFGFLIQYLPFLASVSELVGLSECNERMSHNLSNGFPFACQLSKQLFGFIVPMPRLFLANIFLQQFLDLFFQFFLSWQVQFIFRHK